MDGAGAADYGATPTAKEMEDAIKGMLFKKEPEPVRMEPLGPPPAPEHYTGLPGTMNKLNIPAGECISISFISVDKRRTSSVLWMLRSPLCYIMCNN